MLNLKDVLNNKVRPWFERYKKKPIEGYKVILFSTSSELEDVVRELVIEEPKKWWANKLNSLPGVVVMSYSNKGVSITYVSNDGNGDLIQTVLYSNSIGNNLNSRAWVSENITSDLLIDNSPFINAKELHLSRVGKVITLKDISIMEDIINNLYLNK